MRSRTWITIALVIGLWSGSARADEDVFDAMSDTRFNEGLAAMKAEKYEQARANFLQVLAVTPQKSIVLLNLAICEHASGHYVEALGHLKAYQAHPKADLNKNRELKQKLYDQLWRVTGHLKISADRGDDVAINGEPKGRAPLVDVVDVMPGSYRVTAGERTVDITVAPGEVMDVNLASPVAATPPTVPPTNKRSSTVPPKDEQPSRSTAGWVVPGVLGGLGIVGLGVGVGLAASSHTAKTDANAAGVPGLCSSPNAACSDYDDKRSSAQSRATGAWIGYTAGGLLVAASVVTFVLWPSGNREKHGARVVPVVGPNVGGGSVEFTF